MNWLLKLGVLLVDEKIVGGFFRGGLLVGNTMAA